jgi:uncharacterized protein with NRDE domain
MCTVVTLSRPGETWPLLVAANRDESLNRPWDPPARHWPEHPGILAGRDRSGGGTWMGTNEHGVVAAVLNRAGSLGPLPGKRSRGELPFLALAHRSAGTAAQALAGHDAAAWRSFNLVIADRTEVFFLCGLGSGAVRVQRLSPGLHMITAGEVDDEASARVARHLPRFRAAPMPDPARGDWHSWRALLADSLGPAAAQMNVSPRGGFGTVSASLLALPDHGNPVWLFAAGPPDQALFQPVT